MNLKSKMIGSYLFIALISIAIGFFCVKLIHGIEMKYLKVAEETIPMIESIQDLRFASLRLVSSTTEAVLIDHISEGIEADEALNTEKDLVLSGINKYESALEKYAGYIKLFPDEQSFFNAIKENGQHLIASSEEMMAAMAKGASDSEIYEIKEQFEEYEEDTFKAIEAALTHEEHEINARKESVESILHNAELIIIVACSISFIIAIVFGVASAGFISRPIRKLNSAMEEVGRGDLTVKAEIKSNDEIGSLSRSFNQMTVDLMESHEALKINDDQLKFKNSELEQEITVRRQVEQELAQKNRELEQLIYVTSHDLRSPLVNIDGFNKELVKSVNKLFSAFDAVNLPEDIKGKVAAIINDDIPESQKYISTSLKKMESLLSGLLKLSRLGHTEPKIERLNMNEIVSAVVSVLKAHIDHSDIEVEISELPSCIGDEGQINQAFSNLIENAIKYLDPGRQGVIKVSGYEDNSQSVYCVEDNGIGVARENQEKIFDMFQRVEPEKSDGEGLGLNIVHRAIEKHNGKIWVESEPGRGSRFFVSLNNTTA